MRGRLFEQNTQRAICVRAVWPKPLVVVSLIQSDLTLVYALRLRTGSRVKSLAK